MTTEQAPSQSADVFNAAFINDPYPIYTQLRGVDPIHWDGITWLVTRYADVAAILRDPRFVAERIMPDDEWLAETGLRQLFHTHSRMMLLTDPPDHTRLRGLVSKAFTPRVVEGLRPRIQAIVDDLLNSVQDQGAMDIIRDLAYPLPVIVIAELLGVPVDMRAQFKQWSEGVAAFIGGTTSPEMEMLSEAQRCVVEMSEYFRAVADERRKQPRNDLVSALALAEDQGDRLTSDELVANCILLLVAGHETTTNLIGNGMLALLNHPAERQRLHENPELIVSAVEELLRYDSPVQGTSRMAREDVEIGGRRIMQGQHVSLMIGAANRDPAQFTDPDRLDLGRSENRHLSFALGPHFCLGAPLARLEGQIATSTLLRRLPNLARTNADLTWRNNFTLRGLTALPVTF